MKNDFEAVIGLEVHAQISSNSKMFCCCSALAFGSEPNTNVCPVCMGFPGQLPVINEDSLKKGIMAALALNCEIPDKSKFDRKNYFYPDLPKGYQISQFDQPVAVKGWLEIKLDDSVRKIYITRLHLEDDAGKLMHHESATLCDYNRSGIPLMEIVSEPDLRSSREAGIYARELQKILRYCGASSADMEKGMMRFDASVSIRPKGENKLYPRAEIKNLNSFRSLEAGINYEIERQIFMWEGGTPQARDITVGWSDDHQKTYFLRDKEGADDYRYFPEPDLPTLSIEKSYIDELRKAIPEMPGAKFSRYVNELKVSAAEALLLGEDPELASYFESVCKYSSDAKKSATFVTSILLSYVKKDGISISEVKIGPEVLADLINLINSDKVSMNIAKSVVFEEVYLTGKSPETVIFEKGLVVNNDNAAIEDLCKAVLASNEKSVADYKGGKTNAFGFLVGQAMKQSKGQANAKMVNEIIEKLLKIN